MKKKKKKLNKKRTIVVLLFIYIICYFIYSIINNPIKHIEITGNLYVSESDILKYGKLDNYPSILKYPSWTIKKNIKKIELVNNVKVKKYLNGNLKISIDEKKPLFYYNDNKIIVSNGDIITNRTYLGIPTLINNVDSSILKDFIKDYSRLNRNIIYEMNEIEYIPKYDETGNLISNNIFKITMNDGNTIICNTKSVHVINKYNDIFASLNGKYGTINLDSNKLENLVFIPYEE